MGGYGDGEYAIYTPWSQNDFVAHCRHSGRWGVCFQVITSLELREAHAATVSRIWRQTRPLRHLRQTELCRELGVPWVYLLDVYYESSLSLFVADSHELVQAVRNLSHGIRECSEVSYRDILELEKYQWRMMFQQRDEKQAITAEQKERHREWLERFGL